MECIFCKIVAGELSSQFVYQDEKIVAFWDIHPKSQVHLLIVPRIHLESLEELRAEHDTLIARMMRLLPKLARGQGLERGFRTVINTGPEGGQEINHLHVHLLGDGPLPGF